MGARLSWLFMLYETLCNIDKQTFLRLCAMSLQTVTAATAAAQAAAALGQLAAALAGQAPMEPSATVAAPVTGVSRLQGALGIQQLMWCRPSV